jgi:pilus assembly protein CpaC
MIRTLLSLSLGLFTTQLAQAAPRPENAAQQAPQAAARDLFVTVGKSLVVDSPVNIQRVSVANGDLAEALAVNPREVLVNGKLAGETSLIIWQQGGNRLFFDLTIRASGTRTNVIQQQLDRELGQDVKVVVEGDTAFLRGTVKDVTMSDRAVSIAASQVKNTVNLLNVNVPPVEQQILLKVRFADVDRSVSTDLGLNLFSTGATNTIGRITTGAYSPPSVVPTTGTGGTTSQLTLSDALNVFLFRPDLNLGATIKALQTQNLLQILAEPNVMAINGKPASFLAGGEFPYPTLQGGGGGLGAVTIQFREFGVRINFTPQVTPRGTIRLQVAPEVSSLDFANGLVFQGFNIPALSARKVKTEIELESGQSFAIGGLLDNRTTETLSKVPGLASIPLLGKLFQSRALNRTNSELLVLVTPELIRPIPAGQPLPDVKMPLEFLRDASKVMPRSPGLEVTGPVPVKPTSDTMPVEQLIEIQKTLGKVMGAIPPSEVAPVGLPNLLQPAPAPQPAAPAPAPAPAAPAAAAPKAGA